MRKYTIYLAGQISDDIETYEWRKRVIKQLQGLNLTIINPCNSEFNSGIKGNKESFTNWRTRDITNLLIPKDRNHVLKSDCVIANLNIYSKDKPLIGTLFELGWAYDQSHTMVIGICSKTLSDKRIIEHPFIRQTLNILVNDEYEACKVIRGIID